jgi:D-glycero-alpha-D-manno-heptose-7-phosphate kinase
VLQPLEENIVQFVASDLQEELSLAPETYYPLDGSLNLHKAVYNHFINTFNGGTPLPLKLNTFCDAPAGSGLGSSSTLVVAMIKAFSEFFNAGLDEYAIAHLAYKIERVDCSLQGGRQDQYSATFGGFNFMEFFEKDRTLVNPLRIRTDVVNELEACLVLYFTGISRESAKIIADQSDNVKKGQFNATEAMHGLKQEALWMKECLLRNDFVGFVESMRSGWEAKKKSAKTVSNPRIDEVFDAALEAGALAGKVSGAGGGGFMLFFVPVEHRMAVIRRLQAFQGQVSNCHFTKTGAQAWKI